MLRDVAPLPAVTVPLPDALGHVLAEDVTAPLALPAWDNASMDGFAVRAADVRGASGEQPVSLRVIGTIAAGGVGAMRVAAGEAVRIMTGAPVPAGADSVIRIEDTDPAGDRVRVLADRDCLRNVRTRGEDIGAGDVAAVRGTLLGPGHLGLLASVGRAEVHVHRRARAALLASGDELVDVDQFPRVLAGERIVSSNTYSLSAAIRETGADVVPLGVVRDDPVALRERLAAFDADLLVTSGGVSVGDYDHTRSVLADLGLDLRFWRVRMRPGGPMAFGFLRGMPWFGLPGNPVSALVTFELFVRPALRRLHGHLLPFRRPLRVKLAEPVSIAAALTHFLRATVAPGADGYVARLTGPQGSGMLSSMARANALLIIEPDRPHRAAGDVVDAILLRDDAAHAQDPPA